MANWFTRLFSRSETDSPKTEQPAPQTLEKQTSDQEQVNRQHSEQEQVELKTLEATEATKTTEETEETETPKTAHKQDSLSTSESNSSLLATTISELDQQASSHQAPTEEKATTKTAEEAEVQTAELAKYKANDEANEANNDSVSTSTATTEPEPKPTKPGLFSRLLSGLSKTSSNIGAGIAMLFRGKKIDQQLFNELEEQLLIADVGIKTTDKVIKSLTDHVNFTQLKDSEVLYKQLKEELYQILKPCEVPFAVDSSKSPYVILMVGVNGVGKTTTIGKLTKKLQAQGKKVMLAAGDTFRAAAVEQLQEWGRRNDVPVIAQKTGSDSAAVIYSAIESAKAKGYDVVIADTAGRLQNKSHLLEELKKIIRVIKRLDPDAPHEVMITLDASTGQNALSQIALFDEAVNITGIVLSKLDGTAKGGVIFAICDQFNKPIRYIGVGEQIDDLQEFNARSFIDALFEHK